MARMSAEDRATATTVLLAGEEPPDDVEGAFNDWQEKLKAAEEPGKIQAFRLPIDDRGNVGTTKAQIRLGSWAIDRYTFDELCDLLIRDFFEPGEKTMAVRLVGSRPGQAGFNFNKVVLLQRPNKPAETAAPGQQETMSQMMRAFQEMNERNMQAIRALIPEQKTDSTAELQKLMLFAQAMNAPQQEMMRVLLPALVGRPVTPAPAGDPWGGLNGALDAMEKLDALRGGSSGGEKGGDSWTDILRAVAPIAKPALEAIPHLVQPRRAVIPRAATPAPGSVPTQPTLPSPDAPVPKPAAPVQPMNPTEISTGDHQMFAQLKPQIDTLVQMAQQSAEAGLNPEQQSEQAKGAADLLFDQVVVNLPDQLYEQLADLVNGEKFVSQCSVFNPGVLKHAFWFDAFRAQVIQRYADEDAAAGATPSIPSQSAS